MRTLNGNIGTFDDQYFGADGYGFWCGKKCAAEKAAAGKKTIIEKIFPKTTSTIVGAITILPASTEKVLQTEATKRFVATEKAKQAIADEQIMEDNAKEREIISQEENEQFKKRLLTYSLFGAAGIVTLIIAIKIFK